MTIQVLHNMVAAVTIWSLTVLVMVFILVVLLPRALLDLQRWSREVFGRRVR